MKLGILIPLKAKVVSRDWVITCQCLAQTLESLEQQTSAEWEAIVVGHDKPAFLNTEQFKAEFHPIDFPSPVPPNNGHRKIDLKWIKERALDKNRKIVRGMQLLQHREIDYWYYLDADDLIHRQLVERLNSEHLKAGAILCGGYIWYSKYSRLAGQRHFVTFAL